MGPGLSRDFEFFLPRIRDFLSIQDPRFFEKCLLRFQKSIFFPVFLLIRVRDFPNYEIRDFSYFLPRFRDCKYFFPRFRDFNNFFPRFRDFLRFRDPEIPRFFTFSSEIPRFDTPISPPPFVAYTFGNVGSFES